MYLEEILDDQYSKSLFWNLRNYVLEDNEIIIKAMKFAKFYHKGQYRKSGEAYYMHPVAVAEMILPYTKDPSVIASALMHDVVEDTEATIGLVLDNFGWRITQIVDRLTRDRPDGNRLSLEEVLETAYRSSDKAVLLIKIIDRLHNLQNMNSLTTNKQISLSQETLNTVLIACTYLEDIGIELMVGNLINKILNYKTKDDLLNDSDKNSLLHYRYRNHFIDLFKS